VHVTANLALQAIPVKPQSISGERASGGLSQEDVLRRLFAPATNLPESRAEDAIVTVSAFNKQSVTHRQIENMIAKGRDQLKEHGITAGDKVVFFAENSPELSSTILACWALNAMAVLVDFRAQRADVLAICKKLNANLLVTSRTLYRSFESETRQFTEEGITLLEVSLLGEFKDDQPEATFDISVLDLDKPAFTILTSGTTGAPKVSVHNLRSLVLNIKDLADASGLEPNMTALTPLPISHIFGLTVLLVTQVLGMKTVCTTLEPKPFVKSIHHYKPDLIAALPQFYGGLLSGKIPKGYIDLSNAKLLLCGGAPLTVSLAEKFEETYGRKLNNGYGSTESKIFALNQNGPVMSVGEPVGAVTIDVVNERDEVLPEGKIGEIRITSEMLMDEYLNNEEETRKVLHDGHYHTGDVGRIEDGNLYVVGRKTDVVIVAGAIVYAGEVEEVLRQNPAVREVAVTAVPNKFVGEIVKATVVVMDDKVAKKLNSDDEAEARNAQMELQDQFKAYCKEHLSRYQRPMKWEFRGPHEGLAKTLAGKTDKKKLAG
jgi:long-chain acyl-CoA synthetase